MIVSAASRILSAISLGVFCRFAPSTMAIMRSRKASPGLAQMRTTSQSERTLVPPVTARFTQRFSLRFAAPFRHRFGEVGEDHGKPQPQGNPEDEPGGRFALP